VLLLALEERDFICNCSSIFLVCIYRNRVFTRYCEMRVNSETTTTKGSTSAELSYGMENRFGVITVSEKVRTIVFTSGLLTESIVTRSPVTNP